MVTRRNFLGGTASAGLALAAQSGSSASAQAQRRIIVDSQIHMWTVNTPERPWAPGRSPQLPEPMTIERVVAMIDDAGVDRVVIVPPSLEGDRVDYGQEAARRYPGRFATMSRIALDDPNSAPRLMTLRQQPAVLGIRLNIQQGQRAWLTDGTADWFWPAAEQAGVPVMFLTDGQTALFGRIAERHPQLTLVVDHLGASQDALKKTSMAALIAETVALAKFPNVSVKLSAIPLYSTEPYPFRDMREHIHRLVEAYGPRRCHWGTDVTNSFAKASYRERVTHFTETLDFLSEEDKDWMMGRSILERLRWT
jgi:predicted TIM-barrel fold metal-dependent hydrolase